MGNSTSKKKKKSKKTQSITSNTTSTRTYTQHARIPQNTAPISNQIVTNQPQISYPTPADIQTSFNNDNSGLSSSSSSDEQQEEKSSHEIGNKFMNTTTKPNTNIVTKLNKSQRNRLDTNGLNKLLVDGYIRQITNNLSLNIQLFDIIPDSIINLCFDFYVLTRTMIFFVSQELNKNPHGLYIVDTESTENNDNNDKNHQHWNGEIYDIHLGHLMTDILKNKWIFDDCGVCLQRSFDKLPQHILNLINKSYDLQFRKYCNDIDIIQNGTYFKKKYDVIFKCSSYYSCAIIMDNRQYHQDSTMQS